MVVKDTAEDKAMRKIAAGAGGRISVFAWGVAAIIALAVVIRLVLIKLGWPLLDSDEGTFGIMGMHIVWHHERPVYFYGQAYMGAFEAYMAALLFKFFGISSVKLRLGLILLYSGFLFGMYLLTSKLYTKKLALFTIFLLAFGSNAMLNRELITVGGVPETLFCGPLILLIPVLLASSYRRELTARQSWWRLLAYGCWGLLVGFGLWSHMLIGPFALMGGLLLLVFCWRELLGWATLALLLGFSVFTYIQVNYNLHAAANKGSLFFLLNAFQAGGTPHLPLQQLVPLQLKGALLISLPTATGANPLCRVSEVSVLNVSSLEGLRCTLTHTGWTTGILLLWWIAVLLAVGAIWHYRRTISGPLVGEQREAMVRQSGRLALLLTGAMPLMLYLISPTSAFYPVATTRYLSGLLVCTPAVLWPVWYGASNLQATIIPLSGRGMGREGIARLRLYLCRIVLVLLGIIFCFGTFSTFTNIPAVALDPQEDIYYTQTSTQHINVPTVQQLNQQEAMLITHLLQNGNKHIYSDYWSCDRIVFQSKEQIICSAIRNVQNHLHDGHNRCVPYPAIVQADPYAAYVFHENSDLDSILQGQIAHGNRSYAHYQRAVFAGYAIYTRPAGSVSAKDTSASIPIAPCR